MVEIGSSIRATVTRVEPYGIFLEHPEGAVVVLIPEVSWCDRRPLAERVRPGDEYEVLVLRYNYRDRQLVGSIRRLQPEQNPYRQLARLEPGTIVRGTVILPHDGEVTVELSNGAWGRVPKASITAKVERGDELDLVITAIDVDEGRLNLEPAGRSARLANGAAAALPTKTNA
jgi:ribosomal protein S1